MKQISKILCKNFRNYTGAKSSNLQMKYYSVLGKNSPVYQFCYFTIKSNGLKIIVRIDCCNIFKFILSWTRELQIVDEIALYKIK